MRTCVSIVLGGVLALWMAGPAGAWEDLSKLTPREILDRVAVVWGKVMVRVRRADNQPLLMIYYDEDLEQARSMTFSDFKKMDDRVIPWTMRVVPTDKPDEYTEVRYDEVEFDVNVKDSMFTLRSLQK